jgi:HNH endonuclease
VQKFLLPNHSYKNYNPAHECIYCGSKNNLSKEHIIPFGLGGRWILPKASCTKCAALTSNFELACLREMFDAARVHYNFPTRRKKRRRNDLPLLVKEKPEDDWKYISIDKSIYPFIVLFPEYHLREEPSNQTSYDAATNKIWLKGVSPRQDFFDNPKGVAEDLGVFMNKFEIKLRLQDFCLMLMKIAYSFSIAEIGLNNFEPSILQMILKKDTSNRADYLLSGLEIEPHSNNLHEISFTQDVFTVPNMIVVKIRLLACLGSPTYYIKVGKYF